MRRLSPRLRVTRRPSLTDSGAAVTLDLHGARVAEAERLMLRAARLAAERGRRTLAVVHGASTSRPGAPTIRSALFDMLDDGEFDGWVVGEVRGDGRTLLSLDARGAPDPARLSILDLR